MHVLMVYRMWKATVTKRARKPPPDDLVAEASILLDMLDPQLATPEQRASVKDRVAEVAELAIAEYLRRFPKARADRTWAFDLMEIGEQDYVCLFCRESIVTIARGKPLNQYLVDKLDAHGTLCGLRMLAGHMKPVHRPYASRPRESASILRDPRKPTGEP